MNSIQKQIKKVKEFLNKKFIDDGKDIFACETLEIVINKMLLCGLITRRYKDFKSNKISIFNLFKTFILFMAETVILIRIGLFLVDGFEFGDFLIIIGKTRKIIHAFVLSIFLFHFWIKIAYAIEEYNNKLSSIWVIKEIASCCPQQNIDTYLHQNFLTKNE